MDYSAYSSYQKLDSSWLEQVPKSWELRKLRFVLSQNLANGIFKKASEWGQGYKVVNVSDVYTKNDLVDQESLDRLECSKVELEKYSALDGDFFMVRSSLKLEGIGKSATLLKPSEKIVFECHLVRGRPNKSVINARYLNYLLNSTYCRDSLISIANVVTMATVDQEKFKSLLLPLPSVAEQVQIAKFLDCKVIALASLIEKKKLLIEKLNEQRIAVVTQAVTKGLDSGVLMKDSGVEWLGKLPQQWGILKLRFLGKCQNGISIGGDFFGRGSPFVSYGDVYNNRELPKEVKGLVESSDTERKLFSIESGDVIFTRTSETVEEIAMTSVCMNSIENAVFAGFLIRFRPDPEVLVKEFSKYYFQNTLLRAFFVKEMNLVTRASLSQELLKNLPVLLPPKSEQIEIASYLDAETKKIDGLIDLNQKTIKKLEEYRTALITAAVTGKIDVRNVEIPTQEVA